MTVQKQNLLLKIFFQFNPRNYQRPILSRLIQIHNFWDFHIYVYDRQYDKQGLQNTMTCRRREHYLKCSKLFTILEYKVGAYHITRNWQHNRMITNNQTSWVHSVHFTDIFWRRKKDKTTLFVVLLFHPYPPGSHLISFHTTQANWT